MVQLESEAQKLLLEPKSSHRILIIDDDKRARGILGEFLSAKGYQILTAGNGEEGLIVLRSAKVDLALLDYGLPDMDGLTLLAEIRKDDESTKIIMITGNDTMEVVAKAAGAGISAYLVKPFKLDVLLKRVEQALG